MRHCHRSRHLRRPSRRRLFAPVLALLGALTAPAVAADASGPAAQESDTSAKVARLYDEAAKAAREYEKGRRAAERQRADAKRLRRLLDRQRNEVRMLRADLGRIARAQYRSGGGIPYTAQLLLAKDPDDLVRGQRVAWQADLTVNHAIARTQRAVRRLDADERRARAAWRALEKRTARLAGLKRGIEKKLDEAQWTLQSEADRQVTAGHCRGAVRLDQPPPVTGRKWVAPVETYELSAGFGGTGQRWANRHTGQDFAVDIGTPVRSIGAGRVVRVKCGAGFGMEVVVKHSGGYYSQYAHLAAVTVDQGDRVRAGQWVGQAGTTGNSTGPHLHFEVRLTPQLGSGVDPRKWLAERGVKL
ncbi:M23 family metallopeptidase [Streptomyces sp. O3]